MCGIFGYLGWRDAHKTILQGLKALEYRGYDSWGIVVCHDNDFSMEKKVGRISDAIITDLPKAEIGIGHTRWATHGGVSSINAHPHLSSDQKIAVVHNGIIENHVALRAMLREEGYRFVSETDSEVISHLIEKFYTGRLEDAVRKALLTLEGAYGILAMHKDEKKLVAARKGSPLLIGIGKNELFVASDASPVIPFTTKVVYLEDGDVAVITPRGFKVTTLDNRRLNKKVSEITWTVDQIERKGFRHFMLKEIMEQSESLQNTIRGRVKGPHFGGLNLPGGFLKKLKRVILTACGTSWHAALVGEYLIEEIARVPVEVEYASEFRYRSPIIDKNDLVIVISQSGETADTLAALKEAKKLGAKTFGIVNVVGSTIAREAGGGIYLHAGPEIGVASTKAFTSQVAALYLFTILLAKERSVITEKEAKMYLSDLQKVPSLMQKILSQHAKIREIAESYSHIHNSLYLGRGINFPVALEGALKLKEISYIHAEGYPAAEMKHGPIALIDEKMPVLFVAPFDRAYQKVKSNMQEVKARGGKVIAIVSKDDPDLMNIADHIILIPKCSEWVSPLLTVIPLQLLAYHIADLRGCDIDKPRNLAKSVTVE